MSYAGMKIGSIVSGLVLATVGSVLSVTFISRFPMPFGQFAFVGVLVAVAAGLVVTLKHWSRASRLQRETYLWYRQTHPQHAHENGVSCHACGGRRVHVRALMRQLYHREHFCTQCGTTLYFSPEMSR